jgi:O-antigen ligase
MPHGIRHQAGEWWNPANLPRDKVLGAVALVLISALCYFGLGFMGPQGLFLMTGGLLAAIITVYLLLKYPIVITLVWFLSMSGLHTLVMIRMPGLPDFSFPRLFFVMILFLIPVGIIRGRSFMHPPYSPDIFMVLFTFYVFFNMNTIGNAQEFNLWLISCFTPMVAYFFAKQYIKTHNQIAILMIGFILVTIYFWIVSVGDHFEIESMVWPKKILDRSVGKSWFGRSRGPFLQPALFGQIFGMYLLVHLFVLTRKISSFWKVLITLNIIAGGFGLLYTYTRGGWLATAAGVVVLAVLRPGFRKIVITAAIIGVILGSSGVFKTGNDEFLEKRMANTGTVENRLGFLANASRMIADNPLFGVGYFRFTELRHLYNQGTEIPFYGYVKREASAEVSIHDIYIGRAAEEGLVGLFLFLGFYAVMFREYIVRWKENPKGSWFDRDTIALMGAMTVAYLVGGMVIDYRYFDLINILPCFMAGVIVGFPRQASPGETSFPEAS